MNDRKKSLSPLSPSSIASLGDPQTVVVVVPGRLDAQFSGWKIGCGEIARGGGAFRRGTTVEVWLTTKGRLLTVRKTWESEPDSGVSYVEQASHFNQTPDEALEWLNEDGGGTLGPASKAAWVQACQTFAPMTGMDIDHEE